MRIAFVVNTTRRKRGAGNTTHSLAYRLACAGHEVWVANVSGFALDPDDEVRILARNAGDRRFRSARTFTEALHADGACRQWIRARQLDALFLRFNPAAIKDWAVRGALDFARRVAAEGVVVLNDSQGLSRATSKLYLQDFPEEVRPRTLVARNSARIARFLEEQGRIVIKPLCGYGGRNVFLATRENLANLDRIISTVSREGFVVAQEYIPAAEEGDTRLFLLDGEPIVQKGKHAVVQRARTSEDIRSNVHAGGEPRPARMTETLEGIAEIVRPRLRADGMFFVGLDVAGDKILEINVFCPGGLQSLVELEGVDFTHSVVRALERRIAARRE